MEMKPPAIARIPLRKKRRRAHPASPLDANILDTKRNPNPRQGPQTRNSIH
jgi:hypothetical protein